VNALEPAASLRHKRVVVVGAGQAGLAMGQALIRRGMKPQDDFIVLDAAAPDTRSWSNRWHSLTLFTPARYSALPGTPFPGDQDRYPRTDEVADYLGNYAKEWDIRPRWSTRAHTVTRARVGRNLILRTSDGDIETRNVVAATGPFGHPRLPDFASTKVDGLNIHSSQYTHPAQIPVGEVLVVGAGNTGRQIAAELSHSHEVTIASGDPLLELPQKVFGKDIFAWLAASGLLSLPLPPGVRAKTAEKEFVIGNSLEHLSELGVQVASRVESGEAGSFLFADGTTMSPVSVIWATGFTPGLDWLPREVRTQDGSIRQQGGSTDTAGLYVLGMPWMRSRGSALLTGVGADASRIARSIADRP